MAREGSFLLVTHLVRELLELFDACTQRFVRQPLPGPTPYLLSPTSYLFPTYFLHSDLPSGRVDKAAGFDRLCRGQSSMSLLASVLVYHLQMLTKHQPGKTTNTSFRSHADTGCASKSCLAQRFHASSHGTGCLQETAPVSLHSNSLPMVLHAKGSTDFSLNMVG